MSNFINNFFPNAANFIQSVLQSFLPFWIADAIRFLLSIIRLTATRGRLIVCASQEVA